MSQRQRRQWQRAGLYAAACLALLHTSLRRVA